MDGKNQLKVDFADNPDLKALFQGWEVGKKYALEVSFQLDELNDQGATCTIEEVTSDDTQQESDEPVEPDRQHPVMMEMTVGASGAKEKGPYVPA